MKDHTPKTAKKPPRRRSSFVALLFLFASGVATGLGLAAFLAFQINQVPLPLIDPPTRDATSPLLLEPEKEEEEEGLEFHRILRDRTPPQVGGGAEPEPSPAPDAPEAEADAASYFIQVGSFNDQGNAESLRGELALLNIKASVRRHGADGGPQFRVVVGPYSSAAATEETQARLALAGYNSSVLSVRSPSQ